MFLALGFGVVLACGFGLVLVVGFGMVLVEWFESVFGGFYLRRAARCDRRPLQGLLLTLCDEEEGMHKLRRQRSLRLTIC